MSCVIESLGRVAASYPSRFVLGCGALCGAAALEMTIRAVGALCMQTNLNINIYGQAPNREDLGKDVGGAIFYGLCALNVFPYAPVVGASVFVVYSIGSFYCRAADDRYLLANIIGSTFDAVTVNLCSRVIMPICTHIILPLAEIIYNIVAPIFNLLPRMNHPVWLGVAAVVATAVIYNVFGAAPAVALATL